MKTLRVLGILAAVVLATVVLALLPSTDSLPEARPGVSVGGDSASAESSGAVTDPTADGGAVALPQPSASEQPVRGIHSDTGVGAMQPEASPEPAPDPAPAPAPPRTGGSGSDDSSSSSGGSSAPKAPAPRPSGVCEWDDGELECEDDDDGDDDDDDDEDDDDD